MVFFIIQNKTENIYSEIKNLRLAIQTTHYLKQFFHSNSSVSPLSMAVFIIQSKTNKFYSKFEIYKDTSLIYNINMRNSENPKEPNEVTDNPRYLIQNESRKIKRNNDIPKSESQMMNEKRKVELYRIQVDVAMDIVSNALEEPAVQNQGRRRVIARDDLTVPSTASCHSLAPTNLWHKDDGKSVKEHDSDSPHVSVLVQRKGEKRT